MRDFDASRVPGDPADLETRSPSGRASHSASPLDALAALPATVWMTDECQVVTFIAGRILRMLEIGPERILGRSLPDLLLDGREDHPIIHAHLTAFSGHETTVRIEFGGRVYSARVGPLRDADGRIIGCIGAHQEIAWLPDDEGTLRESDVRLRRVIDSNMLGIAFGDDQGRITDANEAFLQLVGHSREDITTESLSWPALLPVETHQRQIRAVEEIIATGRCLPFETEMLRSDGERVPVVVGAARLSASRRDGVAFVLDISDRKRESRLLNAELQAADALLVASSPDEAIARVTDVLCGLGFEAAKPAPDAETLAACQRIAARLQRFLERT